MGVLFLFSFSCNNCCGTVDDGFTCILFFLDISCLGYSLNLYYYHHCIFKFVVTGKG